MDKKLITIYQKRIFTLDDLKHKSYAQKKNAIQRYKKQGLIKVIKPGLYYILPLDDPNYSPSPIHVASLLTKNAYFKGKAALFLHHLGHIPKAPDAIELAAKARHTFKLGKYIIKTKPSKLGDLGVIEKPIYIPPHQVISILFTDLERTFLEVIRTIKTIPALDSFLVLLPKMPLNPVKVLEYLKKYKKKVLYAKAGLLLDILSKSRPISEEQLTPIRKGVPKKTYYLVSRGRWQLTNKFKYVRKWNLMVPSTVYGLQDWKLPEKASKKPNTATTEQPSQNST
ncbi:MAG: hypothetical protein V1725_02485 [archaeon]